MFFESISSIEVRLFCVLKNLRNIFLCSGLALIPSWIAAQEASTNRIEELTISATRQPRTIENIAGTVSIITVENIEKEMFQAIEDWKNGKKFISRKRMLMAITKHFDGEGLKDAIAKSFSSKRSVLLEQKLDKIRKEISGYGKTDEPVTESSLKSQAEFAVSQLRLNVKELEARIQPDSAQIK